MSNLLWSTFVYNHIFAEKSRYLIGTFFKNRIMGGEKSIIKFYQGLVYMYGRRYM